MPCLFIFLSHTVKSLQVIPTFLLLWFNSLCLLLLIISLFFFASLHMNQGPIVGYEPCSTISDVPLNVSSSKIDDVAANASKVLFFCAPLASLFFIVSFARIINFF